MSIKTKIGVAIATTAIGATLVGAGTFALFTSSATNAGNTFTAGTLTISDATGGAAFASSVNLGNLAPGDSDTKALKIKNNGTLDAWVVIDSVTKTGDLFAGSTPVGLTYPAAAVKVLAGETKEFPVGYSFPVTAGNEYQGDTGTATFNVKAVQARNNTNAANNGPTAWQ